MIKYIQDVVDGYGKSYMIFKDSLKEKPFMYISTLCSIITIY